MQAGGTAAALMRRGFPLPSDGTQYRSAPYSPGRAYTTVRLSRQTAWSSETGVARQCEGAG